MLQQTIADAKMTALMGQTLQNKEGIIKALEAELNKETMRRKEITTNYRKGVREFE